MAEQVRDDGFIVEGRGIDFVIDGFKAPGLADRLRGEPAFIYLAFPNDPGLLGLTAWYSRNLAGMGIVHEPQQAGRYHCTLLYLEAATDSQLDAIFNRLSLPLQLNLEISRVAQLGESLAAQIVADPGLVRLESDLYRFAKQSGARVGEYSKPDTYRPHVSLINEVPVECDLAWLDMMPDMLPIHLPTSEIVIGREDYNKVRTVRLPVAAGGKVLVEEGGPWVWPTPVRRQIVTRDVMRAVLRGETVVMPGTGRALRRGMALRGGEGSGQDVAGRLDPGPTLDPDHTAPWYREMLERGGPGSGHFGHAGRPGEVGGSAPGDGGDGEPQISQGRDLGSAPGGGEMRGISASMRDNPVAGELPRIRDRLEATLSAREANHIRAVYAPGQSPPLQSLGMGDYWILSDGTVVEVDSHDRSAESAFGQPGVVSEQFKDFFGPQWDWWTTLTPEGLALGLGLVRWSSTGQRGVSVGDAKMTDEQAGRVSEMAGNTGTLGLLQWEAWEPKIWELPNSVYGNFDLNHGDHGTGVEQLLEVRSLAKRGGEGSGNFGHAGRPGEVGGSAAGEGAGAQVQPGDVVYLKDGRGGKVSSILADGRIRLSRTYRPGHNMPVRRETITVNADEVQEIGAREEPQGEDWAKAGGRWQADFRGDQDVLIAIGYKAHGLGGEFPRFREVIIRPASSGRYRAEFAYGSTARRVDHRAIYAGLDPAKTAGEIWLTGWEPHHPSLQKESLQESPPVLSLEVPMQDEYDGALAVTLKAIETASEGQQQAIQALTSLVAHIDHRSSERIALATRSQERQIEERAKERQSEDERMSAAVRVIERTMVALIADGANQRSEISKSDALLMGRVMRVVEAMGQGQQYALETVGTTLAEFREMLATRQEPGLAEAIQAILALAGRPVEAPIINLPTTPVHVTVETPDETTVMQVTERDSLGRLLRTVTQRFRGIRTDV